MKIEIDLKIPSPYEEVEDIKKVIGKTPVGAYSLDKDCRIIEGTGFIASNESYNYHNNYDNSKDVMFFVDSGGKKEKWFTLSKERIEEVYNENAKTVRKRLENILKEL